MKILKLIMFTFTKRKTYCLTNVETVLIKKCLWCGKYIRKISLTFHKKRYHTVVESKDKDIESDVDIDNDNIINNDNDIDNSFANRPLIVGPCSCGKTYLMMNEILLSECDNPAGQIKFLIRSPNQYTNFEPPDEVLSIDEYKDCVVVFDDVLECNQKHFCSFFQQGWHEGIDVQ